MAEVNRFEIADLENAIRNLKALFPELADDETLFADVLEGETTIHETLGKLVDSVREFAAMETAVDEMVTKLLQRAEVWACRQKAGRALIQKLMNIAAQRKIVLPQATISIANGRKSVVVIDETQLPEEAFIVEKKVSKSKLKELLEAGDVAGAAFSNGAETLTIR